VYDALSLTVKNVFLAHKTPVAALALSPSGALLATASDTVGARHVRSLLVVVVTEWAWWWVRVGVVVVYASRAHAKPREP